MVTVPDRLSDSGPVTIALTQPAVQLAGNLWFQPPTGSLFVSNGASWVRTASGGAGATEVYIGPAAPTGGEKIWINTSGPQVDVLYSIAGSWAPGLDAGRY